VLDHDFLASLAKGGAVPRPPPQTSYLPSGHEFCFLPPGDKKRCRHVNLHFVERREIEFSSRKFKWSRRKSGSIDYRRVDSFRKLTNSHSPEVWRNIFEVFRIHLGGDGCGKRMVVFDFADPFPSRLGRGGIVRRVEICRSNRATAEVLGCTPRAIRSPNPTVVDERTTGYDLVSVLIRKLVALASNVLPVIVSPTRSDLILHQYERFHPFAGIRLASPTRSA
jgi:hypothetical protein